MPNDAKHYRDRAQECRALSKAVSNEADAILLEEIAEEFDDEARLLERAEAN